VRRNAELEQLRFRRSFRVISGTIQCGMHNLRRGDLRGRLFTSGPSVTRGLVRLNARADAFKLARPRLLCSLGSLVVI
jgi:hypothetical protein